MAPPIHRRAAAAITPSAVPGSHHHVHSGVQISVGGNHDGSGDIPVGEELDAGPGHPDSSDQVTVSWAVQDGDGDVFSAPPERVGNRGDDGSYRGFRVNGGRGGLGYDELSHVRTGAGIEHLPALGQRNDADSVRHCLGRQGCSVDRVNSDVHLRARPVADRFSVE